MIELKIEPYCESCGEFEPMIRKDEFRTYSNNDDRYFHTTITCEHRDRCREMAQYIERYKEKEN